MAAESSPTPMPVSQSGASLREALTAPEEGAWRRFVRRFLALLLGLLAFLGLLNFLVNPEGIYSTHLLPPVTLNTRPGKAKLLAEMDPKPEALILGSSRSMKIDPADVERRTGLRAFNASVNAAFAEDYYVMLRYAVETAGMQPKLVIIGADVENFHDHSPPNDYLLHANSLGRFLNANQADSAWHRFTTLFTVLETKLSILSIQEAITGEARGEGTFEANGYLKNDFWKALKEQGKLDVKSRFEQRAAQYQTRYASYVAPSKERLDYFTKLLAYCRERHIPVIVFLTPMHPDLKARLRVYGYDQRRDEAAAALQKICAQEGVRFYDLSLPESFGGDLNSFYDGIHMDEHNSGLITEKVLANPARGKETHAVQ